MNVSGFLFQIDSIILISSNTPEAKKSSIYTVSLTASTPFESTSYRVFLLYLNSEEDLIQVLLNLRAVVPHLLVCELVKPAPKYNFLYMSPFWYSTFKLQILNLQTSLPQRDTNVYADLTSQGRCELHSVIRHSIIKCDF